MKNLIIALVMLSSSVYAQRNTNTIMNPAKHKRDSVRMVVRMHLKAARIYEATSTTLAVTAIISAVAGGYVMMHTGDRRAMFMPVPLAIGSFAASGMAAAHRDALHKR